MLNSDDPNSDQQPSRSSHESHRQSSVPDPSTAWIHEMFKQQQSILHQQQEAFMKQQESFLTRMMSSMNVREPNGPEFLVESLAKQVTEFRYDPEENVTFAAWYRRFEGLFEKDAAKLPDDTKVRLLLRKLGVAEHERYNSYILPQKASDFCFEETVVKLRALFGSKESCVSKRYKCYQMQKTSSEDYVTFSCRINKATEEAELAGLSIETQKCLIFVCGLKDEQDADVRMKLLSRMEEKKDITLAQLAELCEKLTNLKRDTTLLAGESKVQMIGQEKCRSTKGKWQGSRKLHQRPEKQSRVQCFLCGEGHWARKCTFKHHKCSKCFKFGHKEGFCNAASRWTNRMRQNRNVRSVTVNTVRSGRGCVRVVINGTPLEMMLDTGADITIISRRLWHHVGKPVLKPSKVKARTASGDLLHSLGEFAGSMIVAEQCMSCVIRVTTADLALFGKDAMDIFNLWDVPLTSVCNRVGLDEPCSEILQKEFPKLFSGKLGCCTKAKIQLELKEGATPVFRPKRPVACAMFQAVDKELERLENDGIISKVDYSEWATPIVVVRKSNGTIRVCGDYSTGLNDMLQPHQYPLPLPQDIFASLATCTIFSQIDLSDAFLQVEVEEVCRKLLTVNTHRGLYAYNRLPPGVKTAPGAFQQLMEVMLAGLGGVAVYLDDIVVGGPNEEAHMKNLRAVLKRIEEYGFTIRLDKCSFQKKQIKYLGHLLDSKGLRPDPARIEAILNLQVPTDVTGVRSFLGAVNYYGKFVRNLSMVRHPLDSLLKEGASFTWTKQCQDAFDQFKAILSSDLLLTHYDPRQEIIVAADASSFALGATISHRFKDGSIKVVQHASRTLTKTEQKYSQPDREGLAIIFAVTKFHRLVYGRHFRLQTDHKPLLRIFGSKTGIPVYTANRLQRYALTLLLYDFQLEYVPTDKFGNADVLSRLIAKHEKPEDDYVIASIEIEEVLRSVVNSVSKALPLKFSDVERETKNDAQLRKVYEFTRNGWPHAAVRDRTLSNFHSRRESLSTFGDGLLFGERLIIPSSQRYKCLQQLHLGHPGIERMKALARSYVYWPGLDSEIESLVKSCRQCAMAAKSPVSSLPICWMKANAPWQRVHVDYAGPIEGDYFLLAIDSFSKWPEIIPTKTISSTATIRILRNIFARFGMPTVLVSDNGTQFTSADFAEFCNTNGVEHIRTAPFHPQSNGQAERFVDTFKRALKKIREGGSSVSEALDTFLLTYRSTPSKLLEQKSPAELMFSRKIRTCLELLRPPQRLDPVSEGNPRKFKMNDLVYAKQYRRNSWRWVPGMISGRIGRVIPTSNENEKVCDFQARGM
ncbi:uncharacterized protein K02A2.6-like [Anopheles gambiae]|uniref:uncharacterized protein K02A2.6-like n=1 Tax=Anopheles gambiae TaxID=7165 RepID=UPI002AC93DDC|nr:uncharacterized protein K02A2.6-like [Anopheles gambiae]